MSLERLRLDVGQRSRRRRSRRRGGAARRSARGASATAPNAAPGGRLVAQVADARPPSGRRRARARAASGRQPSAVRPQQAEPRSRPRRRRPRRRAPGRRWRPVMATTRPSVVAWPACVPHRRRPRTAPDRTRAATDPLRTRRYPGPPPPGTIAPQTRPDPPPTVMTTPQPTADPRSAPVETNAPDVPVALVPRPPSAASPPARRPGLRAELRHRRRLAGPDRWPGTRARSRSGSEKDLVALTNRSRAAAGLKALKVSDTLTLGRPLAQQGHDQPRLLQPRHPGLRPGLEEARRQGLLLHAGRREHRLEQLPRRHRHGRDPQDVHGLVAATGRTSWARPGRRSASVPTRAPTARRCGPSSSPTARAAAAARRPRPPKPKPKPTPKPTAKPRSTPKPTPKPKPKPTAQADAEADPRTDAEPDPAPTPIAHADPRRPDRARATVAAARASARVARAAATATAASNGNGGSPATARRRARSGAGQGSAATDTGLRVAAAHRPGGPARDDRGADRRPVLRGLTAPSAPRPRPQPPVAPPGTSPTRTIDPQTPADRTPTVAIAPDRTPRGRSRMTIMLDAPGETTRERHGADPRGARPGQGLSPRRNDRRRAARRLPVAWRPGSSWP